MPASDLITPFTPFAVQSLGELQAELLYWRNAPASVSGRLRYIRVCREMIEVRRCELAREEAFAQD